MSPFPSSHILPHDRGPAAGGYLPAAVAPGPFSCIFCCIRWKSLPSSGIPMSLKPKFNVFVVRLASAAVLALAVGSGMCGCTTAAVATAGTMVGLAASAVSTGADVYRMGKLDSADQARYDDWLDAVRAA